MKKYYNLIKTELKKRRENTKYFNYDFFKTYVAAIQAGKKAADAGKIENERYTKNNIILFHYFDNIYNTPLYIKNGGCYCEFLAVASEYYTRLIEL